MNEKIYKINEKSTKQTTANETIFGNLLHVSTNRKVETIINIYLNNIISSKSVERIQIINNLNEI